MFRFRLMENLHLPLWLAKDTCWSLELKIPGMLLVAPTLGLAIYLAWRTRKHISDFLPNLAICFWITANSIWMADEFFELGIKPASALFFITGLGVILYWVVRYFPCLWKKAKNLDEKKENV